MGPEEALLTQSPLCVAKPVLGNLIFNSLSFCCIMSRLHDSQLKSPTAEASGKPTLLKYTLLEICMQVKRCDSTAKPGVESLTLSVELSKPGAKLKEAPKNSVIKIHTMFMPYI